MSAAGSVVYVQYRSLTANPSLQVKNCWLNSLLSVLNARFLMKAFFPGETPCNHEIMRDALSLCQRLPVMKTESFKNDFYDVSIQGK